MAAIDVKRIYDYLSCVWNTFILVVSAAYNITNRIYLAVRNAVRTFRFTTTRWCTTLLRLKIEWNCVNIEIIRQCGFCWRRYWSKRNAFWFLAIKFDETSSLQNQEIEFFIVSEWMRMQLERWMCPLTLARPFFTDAVKSFDFCALWSHVMNSWVL